MTVIGYLNGLGGFNMHVLHNHFNGNSTILIHDWIINGCERFKIEDAADILKKHKVPSDVWQQVLDIYTGVSTPEQIESFKDDPDWQVRLEVAKLGLHPEHLKDDPEWYIRLAVAKLGLYPEHLKDDPDQWVRLEVAKLGLYPDQFKDDPEWQVRREVARLGLYPEQFKDDPDADIRLEVARLGLYPEQFKDDSEEQVRLEATKHISVNP